MVLSGVKMGRASVLQALLQEKSMAPVAITNLVLVLMPSLREIIWSALSVVPLAAPTKGMCWFVARRCAVSLRAMGLAAAPQPGARPLLEATCPAPWSAAAMPFAGHAIGAITLAAD